MAHYSSHDTEKGYFHSPICSYMHAVAYLSFSQNQGHILLSEDLGSESFHTIPV